VAESGGAGRAGEQLPRPRPRRLASVENIWIFQRAASRRGLSAALHVNRSDAMGAVGLNFGSATSGQGFDVTSTVNQIVANLQSVETPWKTQLASLQSR